MALNKDKKVVVVEQISQLLEDSKLTVMARYSGTSVKALQQLRRDSRESGTQIKVVKNRLFKKAAGSTQKFKDTDLDFLEGQVIYAFNAQDEAAPAQNLANFAKTQPQIEFIGGLDQDGQVIAIEDIKSLASLPSKDQLRAQLVGTIGAPLSGFVNVLSGNIRGVMNVLNARSEQIK